MAASEGKPLNTVTLNNCDREPIHILGRSQSHGVILACNTTTLEITHYSHNVEKIIGLHPENFLNQSVSKILPPSSSKLLLDLDEAKLVLPQMTFNSKDFLVIAHNNGNYIVLEFEPAGDKKNPVMLQDNLTTILNRLNTSDSIISLCRNAAGLIKTLLGYDRVMLYRFDEDWNGEVVAEEKEERLESWLGLHYPATDIPKPSRDLFLKQGVRMISDVSEKQSPIVPEDEKPLDLSRSELRGVSEIHIQYLNNMGVGASLTAALALNGKLWGLIACHHYSPKFINYHQRQSVNFLSQIFTNNLSVKTSGIFLEYVEESRVVKNKLVSQMTSSGSIPEALTNMETKFTDIISCTGGALYLNGNLELVGITPTEEQVKTLISEMLLPHNKLFYTNSISTMFPQASEYKESASGILSVKIGEKSRDLLVFFRKEFSQTVSWGGNPHKNEDIRDGVSYLSPRKSFEKWTQEVSGRSRPWMNYDFEAVQALQENITHQIVQHQKTQINDLNELLISANNELEAFSYSVSHDLRAPLRGITAYSRILQEDFSDNLDEEGKGILEQILRSAGAMDQLIDGLLAYAAVGKKVVENKPVEIDQLVQEIIDILQLDPLYAHIKIKIEESLPDANGDARLLYQLFLNLISNAFKYSSRVANPEVEIGYKTKAEGVVEYFIKDNGIGFDPQHRKKIFNVFSRLAGKDYSGSGIGLAIVKKVIDKHKGEIDVDTKPGKGAIFRFALASGSGSSNLY